MTHPAKKKMEWILKENPHLLQNYESDLDHDFDTLEELDPSIIFVWIVRPNGTHLCRYRHQVYNKEEAQYYFWNGHLFWETDSEEGSKALPDNPFKIGIATPPASVENETELWEGNNRVRILDYVKEDLDQMVFVSDQLVTKGLIKANNSLRHCLETFTDIPEYRSPFTLIGPDSARFCFSFTTYTKRLSSKVAAPSIEGGIICHGIKQNDEDLFEIMNSEAGWRKHT